MKHPILNSLYGFIPRSMFPNKPHPSTVDGNDIRSQGMYVIYREIYGINTFSMVEFSTGGHFFWEFGWVGIFVMSIISGMYIPVIFVSSLQRLTQFSITFAERRISASK